MSELKYSALNYHAASNDARSYNIDISQMGIQTYWGGQAIKIMLGAIIGPKFAFLTNTLPESANVDTASLISFFVFLIIFCPTLLIPPEKLQMPFRVRFPSLFISKF